MHIKTINLQQQSKATRKIRHNRVDVPGTRRDEQRRIQPDATREENLKFKPSLTSAQSSSLDLRSIRDLSIILPRDLTVLFCSEGISSPPTLNGIMFKHRPFCMSRLHEFKCVRTLLI